MHISSLFWCFRMAHSLVSYFLSQFLLLWGGTGLCIRIWKLDVFFGIWNTTLFFTFLRRCRFPRLTYFMVCVIINYRATGLGFSHIGCWVKYWLNKEFGTVSRLQKSDEFGKVRYIDDSEFRFRNDENLFRPSDYQTWVCYLFILYTFYLYCFLYFRLNLFVNGKLQMHPNWR